MNYKFERKTAWVLIFLDIIGLLASFNIAHYIRFNAHIPYLLGSWDILWMFFLILLILYIFDLYKLGSRTLGMNSYLRLIVAVVFASTCIIVIGYITDSIFGGGEYGVFGRLAFILSLGIFTLWGIFWRFIFMIKLYENQTTKLLVLGVGDSARQLQQDFIRHRMRGELIFLSEKKEIMEESSIITAGTLNDIDKFINPDLTGIVISTEIPLSDEIKEKLMNLRLQGVKIHHIISFYEEYWHKVPVSHLHETWFAMASGFNLLHDPIGMKIKRIMDITFSLLLLIGASPVMLVTAILVKLTSRGKIFFSQERVGQNGEIFMLYKFRTMYDGSDKGNKYTEKNDSRITPIGNFLRLTRIDELPQLFNVLKGEMSFIGARAEWTRCVADYEDVVPYYKLRHLLKPGITGWAQVNYPYGASVEDAEEKLKYDLYYIKNYSIWLDLWILAKTVKVVIFGKGR